MRWLAIYLPYLPLEWERSSQKPAALLDKTAKRIVMANTKAQALGVEPGIALATALSLCPSLETDVYDARASEQGLTNLALELGRWSARISCLSPDLLLAEVASMRRYFKGLEPLLLAVRQMLRDQPVSFQLGLAHTPRAALLLAKMVAKTQLSLELDETKNQQQIDRIPLHLFELPKADQQALESLGLQRFADLKQLPRTELGSRFSSDLLLWMDQITGAQDWVPKAFEPPEQFMAQMDLQAEIIHAQGLLFPLQRLLQRLEGYLRLRQQNAQALSIELKYRDKQSDTLTLGHVGGCYLASEWLSLLRLKLERYRLKQPVLELELAVTSVKPWECVDQDLFNPSKADESPDQLISRIGIKLGNQAVCSLSVPETHLPVLSFTPQLIAPMQAELPQVERPLWIVDPPEQIPQVKVDALTPLSGPERIQTEWWNRAALRDYFKVRWPDGRCAWVFRDKHQRWYLQGWFS